MGLGMGCGSVFGMGDGEEAAGGLLVILSSLFFLFLFLFILSLYSFSFLFPLSPLVLSDGGRKRKEKE
jgi:hypothetical protein